MTEPTEAGQTPPAEPPLPEPVVERANRLRLSLVWLLPLIAVVVGAVLVVRSVMQAGPEITIEFHSADGIEAKHTEVRYKEVVIGHVRRVSLRPDHQAVLVTVDLEKSAENIAVDDTRFWIVRPRIGSGGVSGLSTLLSGAYIGVDAGASDSSRSDFTGLESPPLVLRDEPGRSFVLKAEDLGSLDVGSPVYHRRVQVGRVVGYTLDAQHEALQVQVFIDAPYDRLVAPHTRFWNASGIDFSIGAGGFSVSTQSLASVISGGLAFADPPDATPEAPAETGRTFKLFASEQAAMSPPDGRPLRVRMVFDGTLRGLEVGAPIDLMGIEIGTVRTIGFDSSASSDRLPMEVTADLYPQRMGRVHQKSVAAAADPAHADRDFVAHLVDHGLRAQLRTGSLITGAMYVALDFAPKAARARFDAAAAVPTLPTVAGALDAIQPQVADIVAKLSRVPFDRIGSGLERTLGSVGSASASLQTLLDDADRTIRQLTPEARQTLSGVQQTLEEANKTLRSADANLASGQAPLQRSAGETLAEMQRAAQALRVLADYLQRHPESLLRGKPADPDTSGKGASK